MWLVTIIALVFIGVGAVLYMHHVDQQTAGRTPPYEGSTGGATDGSEGDGAPRRPPAAE